MLSIQVGMAAGLMGVLLLMRSLLGDVLAAGSRSTTLGLAQVGPTMIALVALGSVSGILRIVSSARQRVLAVKVDQHIISTVLRAAAQAELSEFENPHFHNRLQRAVFASRSQPVTVITAMLAAAQAALTIAAVSTAFVMMVWWLLPLAALGALPIFRSARQERQASYDLNHQWAEQRRIRQYLERLLTGRDEAKELRGLGLGDLLRARWATEYSKEIDDMIAMHRRNTRRRILARLSSDAAMIAIMGAMVALAASKLVSVPTAVAALAGLWLLSNRVQMVGGILNGVGESILYLDDLRSFAESPAPGPYPLAAGPFTVLRVAQIKFAYPGSARPVLKNVSITLRSGEITALVGVNGSGKTTLAKILGGLYQPDSGSLWHDNTTVSDLRTLRAGTAMVFQDFVQYRLSAAENIAFGSPGNPVDMDRIVAAAHQAGAHDFIANLPRGYDTLLSSEFTGGSDLSLGQWQRLALARAFYRDAPFVILDEPNASLDPQAEAALLASIRDLFSGRTVLLISHRFSSVRGADKIYVLDDGQVIEEGTHQSLMAADETYARLFRLQSEAYQEVA
ncbi:ABC transporter ATP-binding protein [Rhizocola hellebori]|uniref:ABC transporter ATP-binding protein n=1 Tax=Rhizocola hellebori TaxID=1392758 RepID=UPI0019441E28|nr:ABC transporter ATP-binding protein [Rhizocola hellebori]